MFHMELCVFAAMLSAGRDYRDCGRPCEKHRVALRDRLGVPHPLVADAGCRNTVFNGRAQSSADYIPRMLQAGIAWYRVELLQEDAAGVMTVLNHLRQGAGRGSWKPAAGKSRLPRAQSPGRDARNDRV